MAAATFTSSSSSYAATLVATSKPGLLTTSLGDMSALMGSLGAAGDATEAEREGGSTRSWDLSGLHAAAQETVPLRHRFNPLLQKTLAEHERDVDKLQRGIQNSVRQMKMQNQRKKKAKQVSRRGNNRKAAKQARGAAYKDRTRDALSSLFSVKGGSSNSKKKRGGGTSLQQRKRARRGRNNRP